MIYKVEFLHNIHTKSDDDMVRQTAISKLGTIQAYFGYEFMNQIGIC